MAILAASSTENNKTGNGNYTPLKRKKSDKKNLKGEMDLLDKKDIRMRFRNSKDPVYIAFEYLDRQPLKKLAIDFVKDSIAEVIVFVSKFN